MTGKTIEAKATIQNTIQSNRYDNEEWVRFLQLVGEEEGLQAEDTIERSRLALSCFNLASELSTNQHYTIRDSIAKAHFKLAFAFAESSEFENALEEGRKGLELASHLTAHFKALGDYCYDLGDELMDSRQYAKAIKAYRTAIELTDDRQEESMGHYSVGMAHLLTGEYSSARNQFELAKKLYSCVDQQKKQVEIRFLIEAYYYLSIGRESWQREDLSIAETNYLLAAESFRKVGQTHFPAFLEAIAGFFSIDKQLLLAIGQSHSLEELRERMTSVRKQIAEINLPTEGTDEEQTADVVMVNAKRIFVKALVDSLKFKKPNFSELHIAGESLRKQQFLNAYHALNALDSFLVELSGFHNTDEIEQSVETRLLSILRGTRAMDGDLTRETTDRVFSSKLDEILMEMRKLRQQAEEQKDISQEILTFAQRSSKTIALMDERWAELKKILADIEIQLHDTHPQKAKEAQRWQDYLEKGIGITADLIQIFNFLTGISSLPALANSDLAQRVTEFLKRIGSQIRNRSGSP